MRPLKAITQIELSVSSKVNKINLVRTDLYLWVLHRAESVFWHLTNKIELRDIIFVLLRVNNHNHNMPTNKKFLKIMFWGTFLH